jgi:hypothetical protein
MEKRTPSPPVFRSEPGIIVFHFNTSSESDGRKPLPSAIADKRGREFDSTPTAANVHAEQRVMMTTLAISGYRSLRDIRVRLSRLTIVTGANGSGTASIAR